MEQRDVDKKQIKMSKQTCLVHIYPVDSVDRLKPLKTEKLIELIRLYSYRNDGYPHCLGLLKTSLNILGMIVHLDAVVGWLVSWLTTIDEKKRPKKNQSKNHHLFFFWFSTFTSAFSQIVQIYVVCCSEWK